LDENNGRFGKTPEFPNGVYAYFATLEVGTLEPEFPYFIGNTYGSNTLEGKFSYLISHLISIIQSYLEILFHIKYPIIMPAMTL
jgi:hypothetical protein